MATRSAEIAGDGRRVIDSPPPWLQGIVALAWLAACAMVFVPFARDTSAWDALTLHVPGDQGNWWHVLVGLPFILAFPMLWLGSRRLFSGRQLPGGAFSALLALACICGTGTALVEAPFVAQRAGTSLLQRNEVIVFGLGILCAGVGVLLARRRRIGGGDACAMAMGTAYLANLAIGLIVYSEATGNIWSRAGWLASTVLGIPIVAEWLWLQFKMWSLPPEPPQ
ncbi:MAG: hypothetical protein ACLGSD_00900 [Acidobacteriota bacterium]